MAGIELGKAFVQIVPSAKGVSGSISKVLKGESESAGKGAGLQIGQGLVGALKKVVVGAGIGALIKKTLDVGGSLQQSYLGGLDTLYGDAADAARKYAREAAASGVSMNSYAEQAVSFGAALKQAYGGDTMAAAEAANKAILDMADNAAKMGTPLESIQTAYQGFAKQNYTMLDNLKLGYGGTKSEMERLLADAQKISGVEYNLDNLGDVYDAIHVIQQELGLTGVAAEEAAETLTGSAAAMKASFDNFLGSLMLGENVLPALENLVKTTKTYLLNNLLPSIGSIVGQIPNLFDAGAGMISSLAEGIRTELPNIIVQGMETATSFIESLLSSSGEWIAAGSQLFIQLSAGIFKSAPELLSKISELATTLVDNVIDIFPQIGAIASRIPSLLGVGAKMIMEFAQGITSKIPQLISVGLDAMLSFSRSLRSNFGSFVDSGLVLIQNLVDGIVQAIPTFVAKAPEIISNFAGLVNDNAPKVIEAGKGILSSLWKGVKSMVSSIKNNWDSILKALLDVWEAINWISIGKGAINLIGKGFTALATKLPGLLKNIGSSAVKLFRSINWAGLGKTVINLISNGLSALISKIPGVVKGIATTAWNFFKNVNWLELGKTVIKLIVRGLSLLLTNIPSKLKEIGTDAWNKVKEVNWIQLGKDIINGIVNGIKNLGSSIWNAIKGSAEEAKTNAKSISFNDVGTAWMDGITAGINAGRGGVSAASASAGKDAYNSIKVSTQVQSPSKLFRDKIGKMWMLGLEEGITRNAGVVYGALDNMQTRMYNSIAPIAMGEASNVRSIDGNTANKSIVINNDIKVDGAEDPESWAAGFVRSLQQQMRTI